MGIPSTVPHTQHCHYIYMLPCIIMWPNSSVTHIPNSGVNCTHPTPLKWFPAIAFEELAGAIVIETEMLRTVASSGLWHHNTKLRTTISAPLLHTLHIGDCTLETFHIAHWRLHTAHCTLHIAPHYTLHIAHCTLHTLHSLWINREIVHCQTDNRNF